MPAKGWRVGRGRAKGQLRGFSPRALGRVLLLVGRGIHPFHKHFWTVCHVPGTLLGTGGIMVDGVDVPGSFLALIRQGGAAPMSRWENDSLSLPAGPSSSAELQIDVLSCE